MQQAENRTELSVHRFCTTSLSADLQLLLHSITHMHYVVHDSLLAAPDCGQLGGFLLPRDHQYCYYNCYHCCGDCFLLGVS